MGLGVLGWAWVGNSVYAGVVADPVDSQKSAPDGEHLSRELRIQTICLLFLAAIGIAAALYFFSSVLIPFVLAALIALILNPAVNVQVVKLRMPRAVAVGTTLALGTGVILLFVLFVSSSVADFADNATSYEEQYEKLRDNVMATIPFERLGMDPDGLFEGHDAGAAVRNLILKTVAAVKSLLSQGALVLIFVLFLLMGSKANDEPQSGVWGEIEFSVKKYIYTKVAVSAVTGLLTALVLQVLGIPMAAAFGFFAFLLNFIPNIGSAISTLLPLPLVLFSPEVSTTAAILSIAIPGSIQFTIGNIVEPKLMGRAVDLHPVVTLLALIFWGVLWGIAGMFLAVPLTAVVKITLEKLDITVPIADLLAGRLDRIRRSSA